ncbi:MAG: S8 family serine peptidase [Myxococcota bacterium]
MAKLALIALAAAFLDGDREVVVNHEAAVGPGRWQAEFTYPDGKPRTLEYGASALVRLKPGAAIPARRCALASCEDRDRWQLLMPSARLWRVSGSESGVVLAERWSSNPSVAYAVPEFWLQRTVHNYPVDDPRAPDQWYLDVVGLREAWSTEDGDESVAIAVVDNGCDTTHPDLDVGRSRDILDGDDDPSHPVGSTNGHGTACAGLAAAQTNNGEGIAGACPGCALQCIRFLSDDGSAIPIGSDVAVFQHALEAGTAVVSNSWGFVDPMPVPAPLRDAINTLFDTGRGGLGAVVVFAAGNDGRVIGDDELLSVRGVLGVGAVNQFDELTSFSNTGAAVDLVAPLGTLTTDISGAGGYEAGDYTNTFGGTSSACPIAAGIAGLLLAAEPTLTSQQVVDRLLETARTPSLALPDETGRDPKFGRGVINPVAALNPDAVEPEATGEPAEDTNGCQQTPVLALMLLRRSRRRRNH